ncbi:MAG: class I SAM-dependent methyltransferase [Vicinamibacterales bacterium]
MTASKLIARFNRLFRSPEPSPPEYAIAYEPDLIPPLALMRQEGIDVLEEWFRWGEEWSMLLRVYGGLTCDSHVMEIGCGLGRIAFPLRYILSARGSYAGFEIGREKVAFLQTRFQPAHPNFVFSWADVRNGYYNPRGTMAASSYQFPYPDGAFDVVFAASVFTHLLPEGGAQYFRESARVLRPGGRCVFSFFLLDNYRPGHPRPPGFTRDAFSFDHAYDGYGDEFAFGVVSNPEEMTAYRLSLIERCAADAGLALAHAPLPGLWCGTHSWWVGVQDIVVLTKSAARRPE